VHSIFLREHIYWLTGFIPVRNLFLHAGRQINCVVRRMFNKEHASARVAIEHTIRYLKTYRIMQGQFRNNRDMFSKIADVCVCLAQRNVKLYGELR
jgi:hypothetical protein